MICVITLTLSLHIDKRNLLPPLLVIQTLAHNSTATLAVVKVCVYNALNSFCILCPAKNYDGTVLSDLLGLED